MHILTNILTDVPSDRYYTLFYFQYKNNTFNVQQYKTDVYCIYYVHTKRTPKHIIYE